MKLLTSLALVATSCTALKPVVETVYDSTGTNIVGTVTNLALDPAVEQVVRGTGSLFGPLGAIIAAAAIAATGLGVGLYNSIKNTQKDE